jgi:hypothetical protein
MAFRLPRARSTTQIAEPKTGIITKLFQQWLQSFAEQIETQEATQDQMLEDIATALEQAGIAISRANSLMPDIPSVVINADYTGDIIDGQLPRLVQARRYDDQTEVTEESDWSATLLTGNATFSIGAATGLLEITALVSSATIEVTSEYNDIERSRIVSVAKQVGAPPVSSGLTTKSDSSIEPTSAATYGTANAQIDGLTCGASGTVDLTAPLSFWLGSIGVGDHHCWGKWQVSAAGAGIWSDVDAELQSDTPATNAGYGGSESGIISVNVPATGLTPASDYDFRLLLRNDSGADPLSFVGSATATTA